MPLLFRKMQTRHLHTSDMKKIVRVLRTDPTSVSSHEGDTNEKATEAAIKKLPRRLRSSPLSSHGALCRTHKGLDAHLIDDIWSWIKYELEVGIGRFLYPIIMSDKLPEPDKLRARQLEPVVRMFKPEWTLAESPPPGIPPIDAGDKWVYQKNGCPACMLSRIGSDEDALSALFAGMYGHHRSRSGGQKGVDKIKSKRLRFVRYWMRTLEDGKQKTLEAYDLGMQLKTLRHDAKASLQRSGQSTHYTRHSLDEMPVRARHCLDDNPAVATDISGPFTPKNWSTNTPHDPEIGPPPPPDPTTPPANKRQPSNPPPRTRIHTSPQPPENDAFSPLPTPLNRHDSMLNLPPTSTIHPSPSRLTLATSIASYNNAAATRKYRFDPFETREERVRKYREMLGFGGTLLDGGVGGVGECGDTVLFGDRLLPSPSRCSMYSAFGFVDDGSLVGSVVLGGVGDGDEDEDDGQHSEMRKAG